MHGNPSGIDNATSTYGGVVTYKQGVVNHMQGLKLKFLVTDTKISRNTKLLVQKVGALHKLYPDIVNPLLQSVEQICQTVISCFQSNFNNEIDEVKEEKEIAVQSQLEILMTINHNILGALGVGHNVLDEICFITKEKQMYSKLTGAGGGGCAITLINSNLPTVVIDGVIQKLSEAGFNCLMVEIAEEGAKLHQSFPDLKNYQ